MALGGGIKGGGNGVARCQKGGVQDRGGCSPGQVGKGGDERKRATRAEVEEVQEEKGNIQEKASEGSELGEGTNMANGGCPELEEDPTAHQRGPNEP